MKKLILFLGALFAPVAAQASGAISMTCSTAQFTTIVDHRGQVTQVTTFMGDVYRNSAQWRGDHIKWQVNTPDGATFDFDFDTDRQLLVVTPPPAFGEARVDPTCKMDWHSQ